MRIAAVTMAFALGGCVIAQHDATSTLSIIETPSTWTMPASLGPEDRGNAPLAERDDMTAFFPRLGWVRGSRGAITYLRSPLPKMSGPNRTFKACRDTVAGEAENLGEVVRFEASSLGVEVEVEPGVYEAPVGFRILYRKDDVTVVRHGVLTCKTDSSGEIMDAYLSEDGPRLA